MDNRRIDVVSAGRDQLRLALAIAFANASGGKAWEYLDVAPIGEQPRTLVFLWSHEKDSRRLPVPLDLDGATDLAARWLEHLAPEEKPGAIDIDGDCVPEAFRVFNEQWGFVFDYEYAFVGIQGWHAWYGK